MKDLQNFVLCCVSLTDWAKFDEMPMEVAPAVAPSPWASSGKDAESTKTGGDGGWAKFETGETAAVQGNETNSSWANFSPMNWTEQEDASTARYRFRCWKMLQSMHFLYVAVSYLQAHVHINMMHKHTYIQYIYIHVYLCNIYIHLCMHYAYVSKCLK